MLRKVSPMQILAKAIRIAPAQSLALDASAFSNVQVQSLGTITLKATLQEPALTIKKFLASNQATSFINCRNGKSLAAQSFLLLAW